MQIHRITERLMPWRQVPKKLATRRDLVQLLHVAAELNVCPGCHERDTWRELAPHADVLYAPDGTTPVACVDTNRC